MKIEWNQITWYSKILALLLLLLLPLAGFYLGVSYQKKINPTIASSSATVTPNPNPPNNPSPSSLTSALTVKEVIANASKYDNQKVKITAVIDIHTGLTSYMCPQSNTNCEKPEGTVYLKDKNAGNATKEIQIAEKSKTDPSIYNQISCTGTTSPITDCAGYQNGTTVTVEGTFKALPTDSTSGNYIYLLII